MTHIATFHDWADANMPETVGRRQSGGSNKKDIFGGSNPYSTIELSDRFGPHCKLGNPEPDEQVLTVKSLLWTDSRELPDDIRQSCQERGRHGLIAVVRDADGSGALRSFLQNADLGIQLEARREKALTVEFDRNCWWFKNDTAYIYVPFSGGNRNALRKGVKYAATARNERKGFTWKMDLEVKR